MTHTRRRRRPTGVTMRQPSKYAYKFHFMARNCLETWSRL